MKYMVEYKHTPEACLTALDEILEKDPKILDETWFGCKAGEHTAWTEVDASSPEEAKEMLPESARDTAHVVRVDRMTPEQIRAAHQT